MFPWIKYRWAIWRLERTQLKMLRSPDAKTRTGGVALISLMLHSPVEWERNNVPPKVLAEVARMAKEDPDEGVRGAAAMLRL